MTSLPSPDPWAGLDRDRLTAIARSVPSPLFVTVYGSHLAGFASPTSDVDLRGAFVLPARAVLGLDAADETVSTMHPGDVAVDWVAHDLRKFARLMTQQSGDVLEQLYSPLVVLTSPVHDELRALGRGCVTRRVARYHLGFAQGCRKRLAEPSPPVKQLLHALRLLLTGIHLMNTGEVLSSLGELHARYPSPEVDLDALIHRKREGGARAALDPAELAAFNATLDRLTEQLEQARARSHLPDEPTTREALSDLVVRVRLDAARREGR
jgi:predicted nucleotidyltransferase